MKKIGFICALDVEVEGIQNMLKNEKKTTVARMDFFSGEVDSKEVVCVECGIGKVNAAMCAQILIDTFHPDVIINSGIAGSLSKQIRIGDIVISDDCVQHDMDATEMGDLPGEIQFNDEKRVNIPAHRETADLLEKACEGLKDTNIFRGRIASGDVFVSKRDRRAGIAELFGALVCEMEGGAVGHVCYRNDVPYAVIRCISDDFNENEFMDFMKFREVASKKTIAVIRRFIALS